MGKPCSVASLSLDVIAEFELRTLRSQIGIYFSIIMIPKKSHFIIFMLRKFVPSTNVFVFFSFFTLKLFTLDPSAVRLTC